MKKIMLLLGLCIVLLASDGADSMMISTNAMDSKCTIKINDKVALTRECVAEYEPELIFYARLGNYNSVWIFQDNPMGNACNGGDLRIFEQKSGENSVIYKGEIGYCGGLNPSFEVMRDRIIITDEARKPNRASDGTPNFANEGETIPERKYIFENGQIKNIK